MTGRVVAAWRSRCDWRRRAVMVVMLVVTLMILAVGVESARVRVMVAAIETSPSSSSSSSSLGVGGEFQGSVEMNGAPGTTWTRGRSSTGGQPSGWDVESESPPAQRQRDRSLWGMSKRLVPTGPNPLHN